MQAISKSNELKGRRESCRVRVIDSCIDALDWKQVIVTITSWASARESRTVTVCNVHSVVTARSNEFLLEAINDSDIATPDGKPVAWFVGFQLGRPQPRISGMELTLALCAEAQAQGVVVSFYGSQPKTLDALKKSLLRRFPELQIGAMISPPFRVLTPEELAADIDALNAAGSGIVFVGLGCPKQEIWMHAHRDRINAVQVGIGAAFDFIAGTVKRPPVWMHGIGLEWLGRLLAEPRRLWRRYLVTNSLFLLWLVSHALSSRRVQRHSTDC